MVPENLKLNLTC